jgi:hypothetical protein
MHLKHLYDYCQTHQVKLSSSDLIRIICPECGVDEVCPSVIAAEYDVRHTREESPKAEAGNEEAPESIP